MNCPLPANRLVAPTGAELIGPAEALGITPANLIDVATRQLDGSLKYNCDGYDDDRAWDGQATVLLDGEPVWLDEDYRVWRSGQLITYSEFISRGPNANAKSLNLPPYNELLAFWSQHQPVGA